MSVQIKKIDDRDPSVRRSPGDWSDGGNGLEYMGTTTRTNRLGASLTIPFTGTKILIFGTVDYLGAGQTPTSLFSVDGGRATQYTGRQFADDQNYAQKFYESDDLPYGDHVMLVTISNAPSITASFTFDWAEIYDPGPPTRPSSSTALLSSTVNRPIVTTSNTPPPQTSNSSSRQLPESSSSSSTSSSIPTTLVSSSSSTSSGLLPESSSSSSSSTTSPLSSPASNSTSRDAQDVAGNQLTSASDPHKSSTPAVIGGVVGGLVFIILILLGVIICLRRRRYKSEESPGKCVTNAPSKKATREGTDVTPFFTGPRSSGQFTATGSDGFGLSSPNAISDYQASSLDTFSNPDSHSRAASHSLSSPSSSQDARSMMFNPTGMPASYGFTKQEQAQQDAYQRRREDIEAPPPSYDDPF